ncbi:hypothetical protein DDD_2718 [Nonlabens dokdonensis DSW-6]|uniref:Uncharacterized protein n=2 Tax=Nonlabens dokdonensis TaxID=328515 RepID=L7W844_NONDD|nr:hypothetical protein DDD_2718 [Nonlabens dokdonensis DSW-6]
MLFKRGALLLLVVMSLVACSKKIMDPLYERLPAIPAVPDYELLDPLNVPSDKQLQLNINLYEESLPDEGNYVNSPGATSINGARPSVIIAVPAEESGKQRKFEEGDDEESIFGTSGYYNEAEQYVEKDLLRKGFSVLDRSKFEAKLRDLRDKAAYGERSWLSRGYEKYLENGEYDVVKEDLKNQYDNGNLSLTEYQTKVAEVDKYSQRALPGKKRDENEMNDIAEVIRAAQTGADQADYLLQINEVKMGNAGDRKLSIQNLPEVQNFMIENTGLSFGRLPYSLPAQISANWFQSSLNAKLIEIKSGSIVWLGSHEIESWAADEVKVTINVTKKVANEDEVNGVISDYNRRLKAKEQRLKKVQDQLRNNYTKGMSPSKTYESTEAMEKAERDMKSKIRQLEDEQYALIKDIERLTYDTPRFSEDPWDYKYVVQDPIIEPDLSKPKNKLEERELKKHKAQLIKSVSRLLINTIEIN